MYFHLHNHFFGSFSDSVLRIESAVKLAKENNHKALGITDHGTLAAVWPFYFSCIENNIIPVLGCELYFSFEDNKNNKISHLVVLAKNLEGFFNLVRIVSDAWTDNFLPPKYAVVKLNKLIERKAGLIVLSGCIGGPIGISLSSGNIEQAELIFKKFYSEFGKDFYPEVSGHDIAMQSKVNSFISGMCKKYNCNPVLTNDCHYPDFESSFIHDIYIKTADKYASNFSYSSNCFYYKNNFEMNKMNFPETYYSVCSEILDKISLHKELPEYIAGIKSKKEKKGESHPVTIAEPFYISPEMAIESVCRTIKVSEPKIAEMIKIYKNYGSIEEVYYQNLTFKNYCEYYSISLKTIQGLCGLTKAYLPEHRYFIELDDSLKNIIPLRRVYGELIADIEKLTLNKLGIPINQKINISESSCNFFKGVKLWWYGEYETALSYLKSNERLNRDVLFLIGDCLYNTEKTNESIPYFKNFLESDMPSYHSSFSTQSETRISLLSSHNERHEFLPEIFSNLKTNDDYKKLFGILQIFIPSYLLIILLKKPNNYKFDFRKVHYTFLFSDISGFTKLLNELQNSGDQAAEILTTTINSIFTNFISIINEYGGSILKFGGDSLMAMYPENITNKSMAKINAAFTALKIIDFLKNKQPIEIFKKKYVFNIHIGISSGEVISTVLNYKNIRKEYYICGKTLSKLAEAEKMAESGEIVISRKSAIELPPQFNLIQVKGSKDFFYINNNSNYVYPQEFKNSMERISDFEIDRNKCRELCFKLFQFIPSAVLSSIINLNYKYDLLSVNRNIAVVFINISGFSDMISLNEKHFCDNLKSSVKRYFEKLIDITTAYKGEFLRSDISHSGEKFLIIFGAPVCYDNFTENTLRFAIEMRDAIKKINSEIRTKCKKNICKCRISQQTGINYGNAFIGLIGSLNRKEYTVMGNVVNIAARLMSIAPKDKIYCGSDIAEKHSELFKFKKKYAYLKGIKEKYDFFELIGKKDSQNILRKDYTIFLGRKNETEIVEKILYNENFFPYFIHIIGQAGTGKSSFVRHIQKIFINNGFKIFSAGYSLHLSSVPFYMWKQLLKKLITEKIGHDLKKSLLAIQKQYLLKCIPLIANLLDIKIQDNSDEYSNHDSKNNKSEFFQSIIELFFILAEDRVLIILEDIHWIDEISLELLQELIKHNKNQKNIKKLYFIMTQRPENIFINDCDNRIYTKIDIKPFTFSEMKQYIKNLNINSNISNKYAFEIYQKTSGNPFFISQIINSSQNVLENSKIPDSVNSVIISQFDKFFENEKLILSFAAIAGREFKFEVIEYISKKMRLKINLFSAMKKFCDNNFLHFIGNNKEKNTYLFNHDLLRDAIISSISFKIKTKIHNYIGEWIENHDTEKQNEIIAFHFKNAGNIKKAVHYLNISAKQASEKYANNQAIDYYSQLIELYSKNYRNFSKEIKIQLIEIYQARGLAWRLIGKYDKAIEDFSMMLILAKKIKNIKKIISANNHIGSVYRWKGNQRKALKYCKESLKKAMEINDDRLIASCSNSISVVYWYLGKYYKAIETGKKSIELRRKMGDISMVSRGLFSIGNCYTKICNYSEAEKCFNELLSIAQKINDKIGLAYSYDGLGYCCKELAEYCCALDYHQKAYNLRIETGDARGLGYSYISFGDIRRILGDFHGAAEYYNKAYITIKSIQDENLMSDVLRCMALSELDYLNINKSEELITQSIELSERLQFTESTIKSGIVFAEILFRKNDLNKALNIIKKSLKESIRCGMTDNFINALIIKTSVMISLNCSKKEITNNINIAFKTAKTTGFPLLKLKVLRLIIDNINLLPLSLSTSDESTHNYFIEYNKLLSDINKKINNDADKTNFIQKYKLV